MRDTKCYYAAISGIDYYFGTLISYLKEKGLYENTVVIVSADHGDMMGSHGKMGKTIYYEEACGIPFIVSGGARGQTNALIASPDHAPTILGMLDIPAEPAFQGEDFSRIIKGESSEEIYEDVLVQNFPGKKNFPEYGLNFYDYGYRCIKGHRYKYVIDKGFDVGDSMTEFCIDCENDPYEVTKIYPDETNRPLFEHLRSRMRFWMDKTGDTFLENVKFD